MARLCSLINKIAVFPGFKTSEIDNAALFHYVHFQTERTISIETLDFLLAKMLYLVHLYSETFEEVSLGKRSFEKVLTSASEQAKAEIDLDL